MVRGPSVRTCRASPQSESGKLSESRRPGVPHSVH